MPNNVQSSRNSDLRDFRAEPDKIPSYTNIHVNSATCNNHVNQNICDGVNPANPHLNGARKSCFLAGRALVASMGPGRGFGLTRLCSAPWELMLGWLRYDMIERSSIHQHASNSIKRTGYMQAGRTDTFTHP